MPISEASQSSSPGAPIALFRLDATSVGGGILYFCQSARATTGVTFQGQYYTPVDVEFSGFELTGNSALPTPHVKLSNTNGVFQGIVNQVGDMQGCEVQRIRTFEQFLDDGGSPDPSAFYGPDTFLIERKVSENPVYIEWELSASIDQAGRRLPGRTVVRDTCMWRYRRYDPVTGDFNYARAQCPYTGNAFWDDLDNPTNDPSKDQCARLVSSCKNRFGATADLPFGSFPGVARAQGQ